MQYLYRRVEFHCLFRRYLGNSYIANRGNSAGGGRLSAPRGVVVRKWPRRGFRYAAGKYERAIIYNLFYISVNHIGIPYDYLFIYVHIITPIENDTRIIEPYVSPYR